MASTENSFQYSVETRSRFSAFLDDPVINEDPNLLLSKLKECRAEEKKARKSVKESKVAPKVEPIVNTASAPVVIETKPEVGVAHEESMKQISPRGRGRGRGAPFRGNFRGQGGPRNFDRTHPSDGEPEVAHQSFDDASRGPSYRGRGMNPRFPRNRGNPRFHNVRESDADTLEVNEATPQEVPKEEQIENQEPNQPDEAVETKPEETPVYTLDEYRAMRQASKAVLELETKAARAPNDGKDVFANMVPREKASLVDVTEVVAHTKSIQIVDCPIDVTFGDRASRGRPFDRTRGGGFRGGRGARQTRGGRGTGYANQMPPPPSINDECEFPSLK